MCHCNLTGQCYRGTLLAILPVLHAWMRRMCCYMPQCGSDLQCCTPYAWACTAGGCCGHICTMQACMCISCVSDTACGMLMLERKICRQRKQYEAASMPSWWQAHPILRARCWHVCTSWAGRAKLGIDQSGVVQNGSGT